MFPSGGFPGAGKYPEGGNIAGAVAQIQAHFSFGDLFFLAEISMSMRKIYRELAKKHGVSAKEVRQEMQEALTDAYTDPLNNNEITKACQNRVPRQGEIPAPEEAVRYLTGKVKKSRG